MTIHDQTQARYLALAEAWDKTGKPDNLLLKDLPLATLVFWEGKTMQLEQPLAPIISEYRNASHVASPEGWYEAVLWRREHCTVCGVSYRVENMAVCTQCYAMHCPNHRRGPCHQCGGELVG